MTEDANNDVTCEVCTKKKKEMRRAIRFCDVLIIITFLLFLGTHITTHAYMARMTDAVTSVEDGAVAVKYLEQNPLARYALMFENYAYLYTLIILPAVVFGGYWALRRFTKDAYTITFAVTVACVAALINILNDVSIYLGRFA